MTKKIFFLKTNLPEFSNDIAEEIRLFFDVEKVILEENEPHDFTLSVIFSDTGSWLVTSALADNESTLVSYSFEQEIVVGDSIVVKRYLKRCVKISVYRMLKKLMPNSFTPWGSLTGIRPTKLLRELEDENVDAMHMMLDFFDVTPEKFKLCKTIVDVQRPFIKSVHENDIDIYIGIPYCKTRCLYCSFASDVRTNKTDMSLYLDALKHDIQLGAAICHDNGYNIRSTYIGGGTPTVLTEAELYDVLKCAETAYGTFGTEFTVEAGRPDTITRKKLEILRDFGVGRISVNPQTMNEKTLALVGRSHTPNELIETYNMARDIGFIINTDIIMGLPGEGMKEIEHTLSCIEEMRPDNFTVHTLALKRSSRLKLVIDDMESAMPSADIADKMVTCGMETAKRLSMQPYYMYRQKYMRGNLENIGYAHVGKECIYNIDMMEETVSIMAHGADSMSKRIFDGRTLRVERIPNPKDITTYIAKVKQVYDDKQKLFKR